METEARDVARWMLEQLEKDGELLQEDAVGSIEALFGEQFVYVNDAGNMAIGKDVLAEFRKLTGEGVVWERGSRLWRKRERGDDPGRRQE